MDPLEFIELLRRIENLIRIGTVAEADYPAARVKVQYDQDENGNPVLTNWIKWGTDRAHDDIEWNPVEVGEQVVLLAASGDMANAIIITTLYQADHPANGNSANTWQRKFADGSTITYDKNAKCLTADLVGEMVINTGSNTTLTINGNTDITITGDLTAQITGSAAITTEGDTTIDAPTIKLNGGAGIVTGECKCHLTGLPHSDISTVAFAGKD